MNQKQPDTDALIAAGRAIDELRRGRGVVVSDGTPDFAFFPIESLDENQFHALRAQGGLSFNIILPAARAHYAGLTPLTDGCVRISADTITFSQMKALADPLAEKTPRPRLSVEAALPFHALAITLTKYASLLPALLIIEGKAQNFPTLQSMRASQLHYYIDHPQREVIETARATLPVEGSEHNTIVSFRAPYGTSVHLALLIGTIGQNAPLVRVHSSCVTGDILGSMRCDCGDQLHMAIGQMIDAGGGILVYLHQEGRGIGITNKLRAYALQEQGVDTYHANVMLGFEEDERDFAIAASILKHLGVQNIRLLSNNPHKIANLEKHGVVITERVSLISTAGKHNHAYLDAKAKKSGHLF